MKVLNLSAVTTNVAFPVKSGTFDHLQSAYKEALAEVAKALIGVSSYSSSTVYVLKGVVNINSFPAVTTTPGAVFFNGEVFLVDAASFTCSGSNVAVATIATSYFSASNADPVQFTDGVSRNVHEIRKVQIAAGLSGSGIADLTDFVYISLVQTSQVLTLTNTTAFTPSADYEPATKKYVDDTSGIVRCIFIGYYTNSGTTVTAIRNPNSLTVTATRLGTGNYQINHGINNTNYFVTIIGKTTGTTGIASLETLTSNNFSVQNSNNSTDCNFYFQIWSFI